METCGISCMLMALDYFKRVQYPTPKQEEKLYSLYRCRAFKGTLGTAIALCLAKNRLNVELLHSSPSWLDNRGEYYPEKLYRDILDEYETALGSSSGLFRAEAGQMITLDLYRRQLGLGRLLIVQCVVPGDMEIDGLHTEVLHWILVYGQTDGGFLCCDPLYGKIILSDAEMAGYTDTPVGKICLAVWDDHPMGMG